MKKTVIITGASRGIGLSCVKNGLGKGYRIVGCSRTDSPIQHEAYHHFCLDVCDEKAVRSLMQDLAIEEQVYGLLNCAGVASMNHSLLTPMQTVYKVLNTNVAGTFLLSREAARLMKRHKTGRIINFGSVAVPLKLAGEAIYAASKAALVSLTEVMAHELAPFGITCNLIGPNPIATDLIKAVPKTKLQDVLNRQALPRYGNMDDIVNVIDFFLRPESDFITGQQIYLGGV